VMLLRTGEELKQRLCRDIVYGGRYEST